MKFTKHFAVAAISLGAATTLQAAMTAHFTFDDSGDLGANTGSVSTTWDGFTSVSQTAGLFGAGAGSFIAGTSDAYMDGFAVGNLNSFSLSMHVKSSQSNSWKDFVSIGTGNGVVFVLERHSSQGVWNYNVGNVGGVSGGQVGYESFDVDDGNWHHLGITVGSNLLTLYVDGVNRGSAAYTGSGAMNVFQLASRYGDGGRAITTEIDDVAVYNETLTDGQMNWLSSNAAINSPVPESSAALLGGLGALALLRRRRA